MIRLPEPNATTSTYGRKSPFSTSQTLQTSIARSRALDQQHQASRYTIASRLLLQELARRFQLVAD